MSNNAIIIMTVTIFKNNLIIKCMHITRRTLIIIMISRSYNINNYLENNKDIHENKYWKTIKNRHTMKIFRILMITASTLSTEIPRSTRNF